MGAIASILASPLLGTALTAGVSLATSEISRRQADNSRDQALEQLQAQQQLQEQQLAQDSALQRQQIATNAAQDEEERQAALRRAVARQRVNFAGQGIGTGQGSAQAVLLGLFEESEDEAARRGELDQLRLTALDQDISQRSTINVLQRTQLEERNDLAELSDNIDRGLDVIDTVGDIF